MGYRSSQEDHLKIEIGKMEWRVTGSKKTHRNSED
jgi:hypothetical protein